VDSHLHGLLFGVEAAFHFSADRSNFAAIIAFLATAAGLQQ